MGAIQSGVIDATPVRGYQVSWFGNRTVFFNFQATSGSLADTLVATLLRLPDSTVMATLTSAGSQADIDDVRDTIPMQGQGTAFGLLALVRGKAAGHDGPFRLQFEGHGSLPEALDATVAIGDTIVGESLEDPYDLDVFTFDGSAGDELILFNSFGEPLGLGRVVYTVHNAARDVLTTQAWDTGMKTLEERAQPFTLSGPGPYTVTVESSDTRIWSGAFRFWLYRVNRAPESAPAILAPGDTIRESLDDVGDIDEFTIQGSPGQELHVTFAVPEVRTGTFNLRLLLDGAPVSELWSTGADPNLDAKGTHRFALPSSGQYVVRVFGAQNGVKADVTGPFLVEAYLVNRAPETLPATGHALPFTLDGEALERRWDVDEFEVQLGPGELFGAVARMVRTAPTDEISIQTIAPSGDYSGGSSSANAGWPTDSAFTGRVRTEDEPGAWRFRVEGDAAGSQAFRLRAFELDGLPESLPQALPVGVWVNGEAISEVGDYDDFLFDAISGREYNFAIEATNGPNEYLALLTTLDRGLLATADGNTSGVGLAPAPGPVVVRVMEWPTGMEIHGGYRIRVTEIDRAPEIHAQGIAIDDVVDDETIEVPGDIDEFLFTGASGDRLRIAMTSSEQLPLSFNVLHAGTGAGVASGAGGGTDVNLLADGVYRLRIRSFSNHVAATGGYTLVISRRP